MREGVFPFDITTIRSDTSPNRLESRPIHRHKPLYNKDLKNPPDPALLPLSNGVSTIGKEIYTDGVH